MNVDTKMRIIEAASRLFAEKGFEGTSIRDIANECNVNVAAVNYHFNNKGNLYWQVYAQAHDFFDLGIKERAAKANSTEDLAVLIFQMAMEGQQHVRNTMKLLMNEGVPLPEGESLEALKQGMMGPPGGEHLGHFLRKDVGKEMPDGQIFWAIKCIMSLMVHWVMMTTTKKFCMMAEEHNHLSDEQFETNLRHLVRSVILYLKSSDGLEGLNFEVPFNTGK